MKIKDITQYLEKIAPLHYQESYDNSGLITGSEDQSISKALITLDCTESVVEEAIKKQCELIISHHPVIFKGLKQLNGKNHIERTIIKAIRNNIAIYAIHTNLDNTKNGVNKQICKQIGLKNYTVLSKKGDCLKKIIIFSPIKYSDQIRTAIRLAGAGNIGNYDDCSFTSHGEGRFKPNTKSNPFYGEKGEENIINEVKIEAIFPAHLQNRIVKSMLESHPYEEPSYDILRLDNQNNDFGSGMIGYLDKPMDALDFLKFIKKKMNTNCIRHTEIRNKTVKKIALCGGSGRFLLEQAKSMEVDIFITSDFKYHDFFEADNEIIIADIGHYESEQFTKDLLKEILNENFPKFATHLSTTNTNPINYL